MPQWRNRIPSVKTLSNVFGDRAKEARNLLEGKTKTRDYPSVQEWEKACYNAPSYHERILCALNEIAEGNGVEHIAKGNNSKSPAIDYINMGDSYTQTFCIIEGNYRVCCIADLLERGNYA